MPRKKSVVPTNSTASRSALEAADLRLKELGFHPYPDSLGIACAEKIQAEFDPSVNDSLTNFETVVATAKKFPVEQESEEGTRKQFARARKTPVGQLIESRLEAIHFWPIPPLLFLSLCEWGERIPQLAATKAIPSMKSLCSIIGNLPGKQ